MIRQCRSRDSPSCLSRHLVILLEMLRGKSPSFLELRSAPTLFHGKCQKLITLLYYYRHEILLSKHYYIFYLISYFIYSFINLLSSSLVIHTVFHHVLINDFLEMSVINENIKKFHLILLLLITLTRFLRFLYLN